MKDRPILFSSPMVLAILAGRKTQTRRIVDPKRKAPYAEAGDTLWVRETWYDDFGDDPKEPKPRLRNSEGLPDGILYRADHDCRGFEAGCPCNPDGDGKRSEWRPSIFMPRWASRVSLDVTSVRIQRIQDISEEDARAEGVEADIPTDTAVNVFQDLWEAINGKRASWKANPLVWVVTFERVKEGR